MYWFYRIKDYFSKYERHMRKVNKFYSHPYKEETYALDIQIVEFLLPRLRLFVELSDKYIDWEADKQYSGIDVMKTCNEIIDNFQFYKDNWDSDDVEVWKESIKRAERGFKLLSKVHHKLGW